MEKSADAFITEISKQLVPLIPHDFIAKKQSEFLNIRKQQLQRGEYIVISDFAENYSFVVQVLIFTWLPFSFAKLLFYFFKDAVQRWHWANEQCTIHPFAIYYKDENHVLHHQSLVIIAESLRHNYDAVFQFQQELIKFLEERFGTIIKIFFFSDGAGSQYKNKKNFFQLCQYKASHAFDVEWHFFATSHGKGPCDGIGGAFKRNASKASLQRPYNNQITTAKELYDWAVSKDSEIVFRFCSEADFKKVERHLNSKFKKVHVVSGTHKLHSFIPLDDKNIKAMRFSTSDKYEMYQLIDWRVWGDSPCFNTHSDSEINEINE